MPQGKRKTKTKTISRQRAWAKERAAAGLCIICGKTAKGIRCETHAADHAARMKASRKAASA